MPLESSPIIVRLCRTWPTKQNPGQGLHAYFYTTLSNYYKSIVICKDPHSEYIDSPNAFFHFFSYSDIPIKTKNVGCFLYIFVAISKLYGEMLMFFNAFKILCKYNKNISLIHVHSANYLFSGYVLSLLFSKKVVLQCGGSETPRIKNSFFHRKIFSFYNGAICISTEIESTLKSLFSYIPTVVTGNGVESNVFYSSEKKKYKLISIGNLRWQKNHKLLLEAISLIKDKYSNVTLQIYGTGPLHNSLQELIKKYALTNHVFLMGYATREVISSNLSDAFLYCHSSVSEGLPKAILEAISSGTPIVTTNCGACKEYSDIYGLCVNTFDSSDYAKAIEKFLTEDHLWHDRHCKCLDSSTAFSWQSVHSKVESFYVNL